MALSGLKSNLGDSESDEEPEFLQYKVCILGNGTVGKTTMCMCLNEANFDVNYKQTIGLDFFVKRIDLPGGMHVALQIWDIGGQSIGSEMLSTYIFGSHAVVLVYDITNYESFADLEEWLQMVRRTFGEQLPYTALIGNKTDLFHMQAVKVEKHNTFADKHSLYSYLLSAKTGDQVFNTFYRIAADLAGVVLSAEQIEVAQKVVKAEVINYANNEPAPPAKVPKNAKKKTCCLF